MSDQLRETLYFGENDCRRYLTEEEYLQLVALHDKISEGRLSDNEMAVFGLFVPDTHAEYPRISMLFNMAGHGDRPLLVMPNHPWYSPIESLLNTDRPGEYEAENGITQPSAATTHMTRTRYSPMLTYIAKAIRAETVQVSTELALEANMFAELAQKGAQSGDQELAEQHQKAWESHDEGFDLTMSALQCARERLLEANFHLSRITNTIHLHHPRYGMAPATATK